MAEIEILNGNNEFVDITPLLEPEGLEFSLEPVEKEIQTIGGTTHYGRGSDKTHVTCRFRSMTGQELHDLTVLVKPKLITIRVTNPYAGEKTVITAHVKKIPAVMRKRTDNGVAWYGHISLLFEQP